MDDQSKDLLLLVGNQLATHPAPANNAFVLLVILLVLAAAGESRTCWEGASRFAHCQGQRCWLWEEAARPRWYIHHACTGPTHCCRLSSSSAALTAKNLTQSQSPFEVINFRWHITLFFHISWVAMVRFAHLLGWIFLYFYVVP